MKDIHAFVQQLKMSHSVSSLHAAGGLEHTLGMGNLQQRSHTEFYQTVSRLAYTFKRLKMTDVKEHRTGVSMTEQPEQIEADRGRK